MLIEINNLRFDDNHKKCFVNFSHAQGHHFAFVQALDLGMEDCLNSRPITKRYWGLWDCDKPEQSMINILRNGGKWPSLPK